MTQITKNYCTIITALIVLLFSTIIVDATNLQFSNKSDTVYLHFIHGGIPEPDCEEQSKRLGGKFGGHVELQIEEQVYGFEYKNRRNVHVISRSKAQEFNSEFTEMTLLEWRTKNQYEKITTIAIPVNPRQKKKLKAEYQDNLVQIPYDYAVLGMRCTASACYVLGNAGVLKQRSQVGAILTAFYPRQFRNRMIKKVKKGKSGFDVSLQEGIACKKWD